MPVTNIENPESGAKGDPRRKKRMTERQLAANRANAQKSHGPTTAAGKARARFNSLKHGLCAATVCLPGDDLEEYERRRQEYIDYYKPENLIEWDLVEDLAAARWRKNRIILYERNIILDTVMRARIDLDKHYREISPDAESALAVRELIEESNSMHLIDRYETRLQRNIVTATKLLRDAQSNRPPVEDGPGTVADSNTYAEPESTTQNPPNEPIPTTGHPQPAAVTTLVPRPRTKPIAIAAAAGAPSPLTTNHQPLTTEFTGPHSGWPLTTGD